MEKPLPSGKRIGAGQAIATSATLSEPAQSKAGGTPESPGVRQ